MRLIELYAENMLNLRAVYIKPNKRITRFTGKNGAGKSNVLSAIFYALAGKKNIAEQPIRTGQQKATVRLTLGEGDEVKLIIKLRITEKDSYLDVESPEGAVFRSPQAMLSALIGNLTFDPQEFDRMAPAKRLETLRGLVKLDVDLDRLDQLNAKDFTLRAEWNRKVASLKERVASLSVGLEPDTDLTPVDINAITAKMAQASEMNSLRDQAVASRLETVKWIENTRVGVERLRLEAERCLRQAEADEREANQAQKDLEELGELPERVDVSELREQVNEALHTNSTRRSMREQIEAHSTATEELDAARTMSSNLKEAMEARTAQKEAAIASAKMPIEGLGFGNGDVTFGGLPYAQSSHGERMRISASIGMALNPKLRMLFIHDAPLLDAESFAVIEQLAEEKDYQVLMEYTQEEAGPIGIHIVDGAVAFVDGEPVPEPETDDVEEEAAV